VSRAITYARVSTSHHEQNPDVQVAELRRYCHAREWPISDEVIDHGFSGGTDQRPGLKKIMMLARSRKIDIVVVTKLDRLARSLRHLVSILDELKSLGVLFVSINDQIDFTTASGRLMLHLLAAFAEFERSLIRERTIAGIEYARSRGTVLGRPRLHDPQEILELRAKGKSYRAISKMLNVPMGTITTAIRGAHKSPLSEPLKNPTKSRRKYGQ
jgi:DNA invertase Pin-like site-specific DNA recombinase